MNLIILVACICLCLVMAIILAVAQDLKRVEDEANIRPCTMTDCYFNEDLLCRSLSDSWNPALLDNCPDYTED